MYCCPPKLNRTNPLEARAPSGVTVCSPSGSSARRTRSPVGSLMVVAAGNRWAG